MAFRADSRALASTIGAAVQRNDAIGVARAAHRLKGSADALSASEVTDIAARLEAMAAGSDLSAANDLVVELPRGLDRLDVAFARVGE